VECSAREPGSEGGLREADGVVDDFPYKTGPFEMPEIRNDKVKENTGSWAAAAAAASSGLPKIVMGRFNVEKTTNGRQDFVGAAHHQKQQRTEANLRASDGGGPAHAGTCTE
jgi:hypothetical protein